MDDINNIINLTVNENLPILDNRKVNTNDILNGSGESKLSAVESAALFQSSPVTEKQVLTSVNNNFQDEKPNNSFTIAEYSTSNVSNNSEENITSLSLESEATKTDRINSFSETSSSIESSNVSANLCLGEIPVGNVHIPPDVLSNEIYDNQKILSDSDAQYHEMFLPKVENVGSVSMDAEGLKDEKNNSDMVIQDLVDFSFREQESVTDDLLGSFTTVDSISKHLETFPNSTLEKSSDINPAPSMQENMPVNTSAKLLETDCTIKLSTNPATNSLEEFLMTGTAENCAVALADSKSNSPLKMNTNGTSLELEKVSVVKLDISADSEYHKVSIDRTAFQGSKNSSNNEPDECSPLKVENVSFGMSDKPLEQFSDPDFEFPPEETSNQQDESSPFKVEKGSFDMSDKPIKQFSDPDFAFKPPEKPSGNQQYDSFPFKVGNVSFGMLDKPLECYSDPDFAYKLPDNQQDEYSPLKVENVSFGMSDKLLQHSSDPDFGINPPENPSSNQQSESSPLKVENTSVGMSDKSLEQFSDPDFAFKPPENPCSNQQNESSPLKVENVSFGMSDKPLQQFSDPDFVFKPSENSVGNQQNESSPLKIEKVFVDTTHKPLEQFSDADFAFKVPEVPLSNHLGQLRNADFAFKMPEKPLDNENDEQFVDAVQFFRDPNSFQFLENIRTSTVQPGSVVPRSSLYVNFDPLHSKFQANGPRPDNCELISAAVQENNTPIENSEKRSPEVMNKRLVDVAARESLSNILISFDSPKPSTCMDPKIPSPNTSPKMYTEEEVQQKLKIHELETQEAYLKKQREMEMQVANRDELLKSQRMVIEEFCGLSVEFSEDNRKNREKITSLEAENEKLKEDLKTSAEDLQSVENTFTDFYKRYEQCKGMLKTYKDNEEHLKQTILDLQGKAKEQEQMYNMLQERTEEMLEKANVEVDNVKRSGEAQVTVLKAQLKKAEMKISSLESDIKQIKIENSQLGGICDDLMAKVSRS